MKETLANIVLFCGGANVKFLRENCPNERHKFYPIGLGVIITSTLGFISMMFASHAIFPANSRGQEIALILFSLFWAFAIFTIDWGLVKTMRKKKQEEENSIWENLKIIAPVFFRLAVAILLSFSISIPLEIKIYEKSLKAQIIRDKHQFIEEQDSIKHARNQKIYESEISDFNTSINDLNDQESKGQSAPSYLANLALSQSCPKELDALRTKNNGLITSHNAALSKIKNSLDSYRFGNVDSGYTKAAKSTRASHNTEITRLRNEISQKERECKGYSAKVYDADTAFSSKFAIQRQSIYSQQERVNAALAKQIRQDSIDAIDTRKAADESYDVVSPGLPRSLSSLYNFGQTPEGASAGLVRLILLLVIICIDTAPIVIKLLTNRGVYEDMQDADEDRMKFLTKQEGYSNNHLITQLALAQKEILTEAVKRWRTKEKDRDGMEDDYINNPQNNGNGHA